MRTYCKSPPPSTTPARDMHNTHTRTRVPSLMPLAPHFVVILIKNNSTHPHTLAPHTCNSHHRPTWCTTFIVSLTYTTPADLHSRSHLSDCGCHIVMNFNLFTATHHVPPPWHQPPRLPHIIRAHHLSPCMAPTSASHHTHHPHGTHPSPTSHSPPAPIMAPTYTCPTSHSPPPWLPFQPYITLTTSMAPTQAPHHTHHLHGSHPSLTTYSPPTCHPHLPHIIFTTSMAPTPPPCHPPQPHIILTTLMAPTPAPHHTHHLHATHTCPT